MDLEFGEKYEDFRSEVRSFLEGKTQDSAETGAGR